MTIPGWKARYAAILKEFRYSKKEDRESSIYLDSIIKESDGYERIAMMIRGQDVVVIGSGPSLSRSIPKMAEMRDPVRIVADSALKPVMESGISPDIVVTDLDGDKKSLAKISKTGCILVVHAHGDNKTKMQMVKKFKNCVGTAQSGSFGKIRNFGGFTDGDMGVFLANYFGAKRIILMGMDFGARIGRHSNTKKSERSVKLQKLRTGKSLLVWLSSFTRSELYTTSEPIEGFKKISLREAGDMTSQNGFNTRQQSIRS